MKTVVEGLGRGEVQEAILEGQVFLKNPQDHLTCLYFEEASLFFLWVQWFFLVVELIMPASSIRYM